MSEDTRVSEDTKIKRPHHLRKCERMDKESKEGRMADALALGGDEGRDKLR